MIFFKLFKYLHYRLYVWNLKNWGKNDLPQFNALLAISFFMIFNIATLYFIFSLFDLYTPPPPDNIPKIGIFIFYLIITLFNYFWLVYKDKYKFTARFYKNEMKKRRNRNTLILWLYGILSFVLFGLIAIIVGKIKRGEL